MNTKLQNEFGRSMVEMFGVLAIIGVLSVGGVAGYKAAMSAYRRNAALELENIIIQSFLIEEDAGQSIYDTAWGQWYPITCAVNKSFCDIYLDGKCSYPLKPVSNLWRRERKMAEYKGVHFIIYPRADYTNIHLFYIDAQTCQAVIRSVTENVPADFIRAITPYVTYPEAGSISFDMTEVDEALAYCNTAEQEAKEKYDGTIGLRFALNWGADLEHERYPDRQKYSGTCEKL